MPSHRRVIYIQRDIDEATSQSRYNEVSEVVNNWYGTSGRVAFSYSPACHGNGPTSGADQHAVWTKRRRVRSFRSRRERRPSAARSIKSNSIDDRNLVSPNARLKDRAFLLRRSKPLSWPFASRFLSAVEILALSGYKTGRKICDSFDLEIDGAVPAMDKKSKKRLEILRQKLDKSRKLLVDAKKQPDEPQEIENLEKLIESIDVEIAEIKSGGN